ncbi:MAG: hypothetical protein CVV61_02295 [Tenericutes bacterium HGW-Tenericutes-6]|jgi:hypothetical protein|nr:MAG: hypothetical protein CVV61_02295 [Tenericutes bacterium HGW-Tenericutes-6]
MMKKQNNKQVKPSFWKWLHQYRIKIALSAFLVIIPITLILTAYIGAYTTNNKVHFDVEVTQETTYIKDFISYDDIDALLLHIEWVALKSPEENTEGVLVNGYYDFNLRYEAKEGYSINNVSVTPLLQTPWTNIRSLGTTQNLTTSNRVFRIIFNYELPVRPLWFVTVEEANLYLKVDYTFTSAGSPITKTVYVLYPLENITPKPIV